MNTNLIKKFATEARIKLKRDIEFKISSLGFDIDGKVRENYQPKLIQGGSIWKGKLQPDGFYQQWIALYNRIQEKGIKEVCEEAAYTWFNRLIAIHILQKNGLCEKTITYIDTTHTPCIVNEAKLGNFPQMPEANLQYLMKLMGEEDSNESELFALLIIAWCHQNPIMQACFGNVSDYTELLLPINILDEGFFIDMLNNTEFLSNEDYHSPELIGWLYQFYISERKDEVLSKKGKYTSDEIPAATQIFTPNWIVKYMVQNTVGRIYLDKHPNAYNEFKAKWRYLVESDGSTPSDKNFHFNELTDLKIGDLSCGSGHILNECFDILYDLYISEGYTRSEAIENIFTKNIIGIDIDTRAKQLSTFALLLKACQKDKSFSDAHCMPRVYDMPKCNLYTWKELNHHMLCNLNIPHCSDVIDREISEAFDLMGNADSLGSIMKFNISKEARDFIKNCINNYCLCNDTELKNNFIELFKGFETILELTETYSALVMNPPYMSSGKMNKILSEYVGRNYVEGKADLCTTFMLLAADRLADHGKYGMINMQSWMFLPSFEHLRKSLLDNYHIENFLHLGPRTFDELSGEVVQNTAFIVSNNNLTNGTYYRLVDGKNCSDKERMFLAKEGFYPNISQSDFKKIPGCTIGYWVSKLVLQVFDAQPLEHYANAKKGLSTGDNNRFLKLWYEVSSIKTIFSPNSFDTDKKWFPINKGGSYRKWYGNNEFLINWENDGQEIRNFEGSVIRNYPYYLKECITWSMLSSSYFGVRFSTYGKLFEGAGPSLFATKDTYMYIIGFLCSKVANFIIRIFNPTINININDVQNLPLIISASKRNVVETKSYENIAISKEDWDSHETSWDFKINELVALRQAIGDPTITLNGEEVKGLQLWTLENFIANYKSHWERNFEQLHTNEEELNRHFIEIYGLQNELTPNVPLEEVTILQQGEISIKNNKIVWHNDVIIKQLISYAVGIWMGRYRLDKLGLNIAHPNPSSDEMRTYKYGEETVCIDADAIIPILPSGSPFEDNLPNRISDFIRITFGDNNHSQNLNYMEEQLGMEIEKYLIKDFWKDHKKMYHDKPIYWLFSSKKGSFKCITYMHRMDSFTADKVRKNYLLPYIEWLQNKLNYLLAHAAQLSTSERKDVDNIKKAIEDCKEYQERLQVLAEDTERTTFNLDDGIKVNYAKYGDLLAKI